MSEQQTRQRMVAAAARLFQRQGYHATGFRQIVAESRTPRGSIYHHFPQGKEQLGVEAIGVAAEMVAGEVRRTAARSASSAELIRGVALALAGWLEGSAFREGCPVATVALECAPETTALADACRDAFASWIELIAGFLRAEGWDAEDASRRATTVIAAVEGALLISRAARDTSALRAVADDLGAPAGVR